MNANTVTTGYHQESPEQTRARKVAALSERIDAVAAQINAIKLMAASIRRDEAEALRSALDPAYQPDAPEADPIVDPQAFAGAVLHRSQI